MEKRTEEWFRQADYDMDTAEYMYDPMDKKAALDIIARFRQGIEARGIRLQKIILYGSFATGATRSK